MGTVRTPAAVSYEPASRRNVARHQDAGRDFPPPRAWEEAPRQRWPFVVLAIVAVVAALAVTVLVRSTPITGTAYYSDAPSMWRVGHVPALYQTDPQWADDAYAGATIGSSGCGPTCLSAVAIALTGNESLTPPVVAAYAEGNGHVTDGLTAWTLMTEGAQGLGLEAREEPASVEAVTAALKAGRPVIASVGPGDFTTTGHFIVLTNLDSDGTLHVMDPNSQPRTRKGWDLEAVLEQTCACWSFSAA